MRMGCGCLFTIPHLLVMGIRPPILALLVSVFTLFFSIRPEISLWRAVNFTLPMKESIEADKDGRLAHS